MSEVTQILCAIERGDLSAAKQLLPLVYDELRRLTAKRLASEKPGQTLQATALVHEAYLRLVRGRQAEGGTVWGTSSPLPPRPCAASSTIGSGPAYVRWKKTPESQKWLKETPQCK
jgi:hypothetical protein